MVVQQGWSQQVRAKNHAYSWGVVIANRSTTKDAVGVTVTVTPYAKGYGRLDSSRLRLALVPAGHFFDLGDAEGSFARLRITNIRVAVQVGWMQPKHLFLPPVSAIRLDRCDDSLTAMTTNPYDVPINVDDAHGFLVAFDRTGRIVGGANTDLLSPGHTSLLPRNRLAVSFSLFGVPMSRVDHVGISIDP